MLSLAYPWALVLLPLPLLVRWLLPAYHEARPAVRLPFFRQLAEVTGAKLESGAAARRRSWIQGLLFVLVWIGVLLALARPQWLEPPVTREVPTRDLLLAVDLSGSMETRDFTGNTGEQVDRLSAVKEVLGEFLTRRQGDRVGLIVFGNAAFVQAPFTQDLDAVQQLLEQTAPRMAGPKTAFGDAIGLGLSLFERSEVEERVMIALTDGNDTGSQVPPAKAAGIAATRGVVIHTVAIGDPTSVGEEALDEKALKAVAETSGGQYFFAADRDSLEGIYETLDRLETRKVETISHRPRRELFFWPLGAALLIGVVYHLGAAVAARRRSPVQHGPTPSDD